MTITGLCPLAAMEVLNTLHVRVYTDPDAVDSSGDICNQDGIVVGSYQLKDAPTDPNAKPKESPDDR